MPLSSYKKLIRNRLWNLLEFHGPVTDVLAVGNRFKQNTAWGNAKLRGPDRRPAGFPCLTIGAGRFRYDTLGDPDELVLAAEGRGYVSGGVHNWPMPRQVTFVARLIGDADQSDKIDDLDDLEEEIQRGWLLAGPKLERLDVSPALPELAFLKAPWGPITGSGPADTTRDPLFPGKRVWVTTLEIPFGLELDGRSYAAGTQE